MPDRRHPAPVRLEHDRPRLQAPRRPADLRARHGPLVPRRLLGGPLDVRARQGPAAGLREDSRREPQGEREGVGAGHAAGAGGRDRQQPSRDGGDQAGRREAPGRRSTMARPSSKPIEGTSLSYVVNSPIPVIQVSPTSYYALRERRLVRRARAPGPVGGGDHGARRHLLDPAELAAPLRDLRLRLSRHARRSCTSATRRATTASTCPTASSSTAPATTTRRGTAPSGTARPSRTASRPPRPTRRGRAG